MAVASRKPSIRMVLAVSSSALSSRRGNSSFLLANFLGIRDALRPGATSDPTSYAVFLSRATYTLSIFYVLENLFYYYYFLYFSHIIFPLGNETYSSAQN